ncbi:hypothetical protein AAE478_001963 [Parahypoxylon ruwenzoriense]
MLLLDLRTWRPVENELRVGDDNSDGLVVAYEAYEAGKLARITFLNLEIWTADGVDR